MKKTIVIWFSAGAASAVAAKKIIEKYGDSADIRVVNNPILEEHEDNLRFLRDVEKWLGVEVEYAINPKFPDASIVSVFDAKKYVSGLHFAPCTVELKVNARKNWMKENKADFHVLGFTVEEKAREQRFREHNPDVQHIAILIEQNITKEMTMMILSDAGIRLPEIYAHGFPNANCLGCVKASSPSYWNLLRIKFPDVFEQRAEQSRRLGARLVRVHGKRLFLDELDESEKARGLKSMNVDCGLFCEREE